MDATGVVEGKIGALLCLPSVLGQQGTRDMLYLRVDELDG